MYILEGESKELFEKMVVYADKCMSLIPLSFVLGFFVSNVMARWWTQYNSIPWPTGMAVYVSSTIHGYDEVGRAMRRTIMRYVCLSMTMVFRVLSPNVQQRYPKMSDLIDAGFLHENELKIIESLETKYPELSKNFLPIVWAASIVTKARAQGRIYDDFAVKTLIKELNSFRGKCGALMAYHSISIPLVYTQVVTIATYSYFLTMIMAQQVLDDNEHHNKQTFVFPFIMILLFIFNMGWLKVAESLLNPFGEDDDDFDLCSMIDKNMTTAYLIVDDMHNEHPEIVKDQYWDGYLQPYNSIDKKSVPGPINEQDFIDFSEKKITKANTNAEVTEIQNFDEENVRENEDRSSVSAVHPRESVIAARYSQKIDQSMLMNQFVLEKNMDRVRRRTGINVKSATDDGSSVSSVEVTQVETREPETSTRKSSRKTKSKK